MIKKALLIIDMLNDFIRENGKLYIRGSGGKIILSKRGSNGLVDMDWSLK